MQLDKTQISVRERTTLDIFDLALQVTRRFARPMILSSLLLVLPMLALNHALIGWMLREVAFTSDFGLSDFGALSRFLWTMYLLVYIQSPVASFFATSFLGKAVFEQRPRLWDVVKEVSSMTPQILWCVICLRGIAPAILLMLLVRRDEPNTYTGWEFLLVLLAMYVAILRMVRPYLSEIILLEKNPLSSRDDATVTVGRRSGILHSANTGETFVRWLASLLIGTLLFISFMGLLQFSLGVFLNLWVPGRASVILLYPLTMWGVACFFTVVRFLFYLDLRIRDEGWEVELRLRAEATRLASSLS